MKGPLIILVFIYIPLQSICQENFVEGLIIEHGGDTVGGYINDQFWVANPVEVEFKYIDGNTKKLYPSDIRAFIIGRLIYRSVTVKYDASGIRITDLSEKPQPAYKEASLFLKVIVESQKSLLEYKRNDGRVHYFIDEGGKTEELVNHPYLVSINGLQNRQLAKLYIGQLQIQFSDCQAVRVTPNLSYSKKSLKKLFIDYNNCIGVSSVNDRDQTARTLKYFGLFTNLAYENYRQGYNSKFGYGIGISFNLATPHKQYQTSYFVELAYHKFPDQTKYYKSNGFYYDELIKTNSMKLAAGFRSRFDKSKHKSFISGGAIGHFGLKDEYRLIDNNVSIYVFKDRFWPNGSIFIGLGTWFNKFNIEMRYEKGAGVSLGQNAVLATGASGFSSLNLTTAIKLN